MAAEDAAEELEEVTEDGDEGGESEESKSKSKLPLIIGGSVGLLLIAGVAAFLLGVFDGEEKKTSEGTPVEEVIVPTEIIYYEFPQILVNLNEPGRKGKFLKLSIVFELASADDIPLIEKLEPRIIDQFQMYLRELRFEDLQGSEGVHRLREELLRRVNSEAGKDKVTDVLFKSILVQ